MPEEEEQQLFFAATQTEIALVIRKDLFGNTNKLPFQHWVFLIRQTVQFVMASSSARLEVRYP